MATIRSVGRGAKRLAGVALLALIAMESVRYGRSLILEAHTKRTMAALRRQGDPGCFALLTGRASGATMRCRIGTAEIGNVVQDYSASGAGIVLMIGAMRSSLGLEAQPFVAEGLSPLGKRWGKVVSGTLRWPQGHPGTAARLEIPTPSQDYPYILWLHR